MSHTSLQAAQLEEAQAKLTELEAALPELRASFDSVRQGSTACGHRLQHHQHRQMGSIRLHRKFWEQWGHSRGVSSCPSTHTQEVPSLEQQGQQHG
jgi:hypothetical protein